MGSKYLSHFLIEKYELSYLVARGFSHEERMIIISHMVKILHHEVPNMCALKAACCMIKHFYGEVIYRDFLRSKLRSNIYIALGGVYTAICHHPSLKAGGRRIQSEGRYKAMSMPVQGNNCFWHAMVTVFNGYVGSNKYTVRDLKDLYKEEAMKYKELFVPHMCNEVEYAYLIEGRTQDVLSTKHEADASVAHVVSTEVGIPICVVDDTGKEIMGYRLGSGEHEGRTILIRHGHAYVPTKPIPKEDLSHLPPYDYHIAHLFKGDDFDLIEQEEAEDCEDSSEDEESVVKELPTGINPDPSVEEEEIGTTTDFVTAIQSALSFMQKDSKVAKAATIAKAVAPFVTLSCGMFTLIRGIVQGVWTWHDYLVHVTSLVSKMISVYACLWEIASHARIAKMLNSIVMKMITVFGAGTLVASGFTSAMGKIGPTISAVKQTGDYMTDIINNLGQLFVFDLTDRLDLNKTIIARTKKLHGYLAMPTSTWTGDLYAEIESYSQDCRLMVQTNRAIGHTVTVQSMMKLIKDVDDRLRSIRKNGQHERDAQFLLVCICGRIEVVWARLNV